LTKFRQKWNDRTVWKPWARASILSVLPVPIAVKFSPTLLFISRTVYLTAKKIGTSSSPQNASLAASQSRQGIAGLRLLTITTILSASTARCAKRIWRAKVSLWKLENHSVKATQEVEGKSTKNFRNNIKKYVLFSMVFVISNSSHKNQNSNLKLFI